VPRVCWIDAHLEYRSPTTLHLLHALPHLRAAGWQVEIWCLRSDAPRDQAKHVFLPAPRWLGPLELLWFTLAVNFYGLWRRLRGDGLDAEVVHATCGVYFGANLISVHFLNAVWLRKRLRLGFHSAREIAGFLLGVPSLFFERLALRSPHLRKILAVSDAIAAETKKRSSAEIEVLPNSYDETRFNAEARTLHREATRAALGLSPEETLFLFVSQGHYERKGLWLAVEALSRLREQGRRGLRLLIVGGAPRAVEALRGRLAEWALLAGMQREVEKYYAAADAFILPSHFEANPLAAMEAAAVGLPLLLTPFHGSEMTLRDGINGFLLDYDPARMSEQIARFLDDGLPPFAPGPCRGLNRRQYAERLLAVYGDIWRG